MVLFSFLRSAPAGCWSAGACVFMPAVYKNGKRHIHNFRRPSQSFSKLYGVRNTPKCYIFRAAAKTCLLRENGCYIISILGRAKCRRSHHNERNKHYGKSRNGSKDKGTDQDVCP